MESPWFPSGICPGASVSFDEVVVVDMLAGDDFSMVLNMRVRSRK